MRAHKTLSRHHGMLLACECADLIVRIDTRATEARPCVGGQSDSPIPGPERCAGVPVARGRHPAERNIAEDEATVFSHT
jgi:hypothetical protein